MSRFLGIIVGVLSMVLGVWCLFTPVATYGVIGWLIALAMIADGIAKVAVWSDYRKIGVSDTWALVGGVLSIILGIILSGSMAARIAVDTFIATLVACWILVSGCVRIARSFRMRNVHRTLNTALGSNWGLALVMGILMVVLGIFCIANPLIVMVALGWQIGFAMIAGGASLITATA